MKKTVKVKQSIRNGKVVKAHTRTIDTGSSVTKLLAKKKPANEIDNDTDNDMKEPLFNFVGGTEEEALKKIEADTKIFYEALAKAKAAGEAKGYYSKDPTVKRDVAAANRHIKLMEEAEQGFKDAIAFHKKFNALYSQVKDDLTSTNSKKVQSAHDKLMEIRPWSSMFHLGGKLKRMARTYGEWRADGKKWYSTKSPEYLAANTIAAIKRRYDNLEEGGKLIGLSEKQRIGRQKQAAAMSARWGSY